MSRAIDLIITYRVVKMLVTPFKKFKAFELGIIDENGKRIKKVKLDDEEKKSAYTPFIRLAANIKRLVAKIPGGGTKLGSFASALYLIKEKVGTKGLEKICKELNVDLLDFLNERNEWFLLDDKQLTPGIYKVSTHKLLNKTCDELVWPKDQIRISEESFPVGEVFGVDIYEATHINTNRPVYVTVGELLR